MRVRWVDFSGSANNEQNAGTFVGLMCAYNLKDTSATPVIHPTACHCNIAIHGSRTVARKFTMGGFAVLRGDLTL